MNLKAIREHYDNENFIEHTDIHKLFDYIDRLRAAAWKFDRNVSVDEYAEHTRMQLEAILNEVEE